MILDAQPRIQCDGCGAIAHFVDGGNRGPLPPPGWWTITLWQSSGGDAVSSSLAWIPVHVCPSCESGRTQPNGEASHVPVTLRQLGEAARVQTVRVNRG